MTAGAETPTDMKTNVHDVINFVRTGSSYVDVVFIIRPFDFVSSFMLLLSFLAFASEKAFSLHFSVFLFHLFSQLWILPIEFTKLLVTLKGLTFKTNRYL